MVLDGHNWRMKNQSKTDESMDVLEQLKQLSAMMREQLSGGVAHKEKEGSVPSAN